MTKIIIFASGKGGTGKTVSSINFSLALNYLNHKVLLIDGNIKKPNLSLHFNMPPEKNLHDMHRMKYKPVDIVKTHPSGLNLVFGGTDIQDFDHIDYKKVYDVIKFLKNNLHYHDFIIIDSASNFATEFFHALNLGEETIIVTKMDKISIHDAKKTIHLAEDEGTSVIGVIVNGYGNRSRKIDLKEIERELKRPVLGFIPHDKNVAKSIKIGHPVLCSYPNSKISQSFMEIGKKFSDLNRHIKNGKPLRKAKK